MTRDEIVTALRCCADNEVMAELKRCPECGGVATVIHMYDTYDRADFGWDAGCGRYRAGDGLHTKKMKVSGLPSKEKAIEAWNRMADNVEGQCRRVM